MQKKANNKKVRATLRENPVQLLEKTVIDAGVCLFGQGTIINNTSLMIPLVILDIHILNKDGQLIRKKREGLSDVEPGSKRLFKFLIQDAGASSFDVRLSNG